MIIDSLLFFGTKALSAGDAACPDVVDAKVAGDAIGDELYFHAKTGATAPAGGTSVVVKLQTSDNSAFNSGVVDLMTSPTIPLANLKASKFIFSGRMPMGAKRYLRAFVDATGTFSAGEVTCFISHGPEVK